MPDRPYKRLPGRSRQLFNASSLWDGKDHLLQVNSHGVTESYRRFFYRDIQALVICQTKGHIISTIVLGLLAAATGIPVAFLPVEVAVVFGFFAGVFLIAVLINVLRGPTCRATLRTAVQTQDLPSLNRVRTARKLLGLLQPRIMAAQQEIEQP
jgi:hypothetical protein